MAVRTRSSSGVGWAALVAGVASVATLPVAIYATRFSDAYELLHAGLAIPLALALALAARGLGGRAERQSAIRLDGRTAGPARAGRVLGTVGLCLVAAALVALGVYGLLEYVGSRE